ncbi:MAG TPA: glycosyltransferase [Burkholderiales bacterium]|nr:glycosyltransferase [Betaproteobacteria bacterium]HQR51843.1 glycosyltransferase [Burkholderiales bacterium]
MTANVLPVPEAFHGTTGKRCEPRWPDTLTGRVVHVVGRVTDEVFSFLGPATSALARLGVRQAVVMIDDARYRCHLARIHESVEVILAPSTRNPIHQWREVLRACRVSLEGGPLHAVHLHGLLPCLVGAGAVRSARLQLPILYSPHGSRSLGSMRTMGVLAPSLIRPLIRPLPHAAIVTVPREAFAFEKWESVAVVENPVAEVFHKVRRHEARQPLIVTGGRGQDRRGVARFAQFAVLLGGDLRVGFNWLGTVDASVRQRLTAANVAVFDVTSEQECASRLASAWIYAAPGATRGFPLFLARAMAVGLPCVVADSPHHRGVIRHGETGFLCRSERAMLERIATLLDNPGLRARIGAAARDEARSRFGEHRFSASLLAAYAENALRMGVAEIGGVLGQSH